MTTTVTGSDVRMTLAPPPLDWEPFESWLRRMAAANVTSLAWVAQRVGLQVGKNSQIRQKGWGVFLTPNQRDRVARITGITPDSVAATLLTRFEGTLLPDQVVYDTNLIARQEWVLMRASLYCPLCLHERHGAWHLFWRFPWSFACTEHGRLLVASCPRCGLVPNEARTGGSTMPSYPSQVLQPGICLCQPPLEQRRAGGTSACGARLDRAEPGDELPRWLLDDQESLHRSMDPQRVQRRDHEWWNDLRACASTILAVGVADTLEAVLAHPLPLPVTSAWEDWITGRDAALAQALQMRAEHPDKQVKVRLNTHHDTPTDPILMAGVVAAAMRMVDPGDHGLDSVYEHSLLRQDGIHWLPYRLSDAGGSRSILLRMHEVVIQHRRGRR